MRQQLQFVYSALMMGLIMMMIILWMPWLVAAAAVLMGVLVLAGLIGWFWFGRKLRKMVKDVENEMQNQMRQQEQAQGAWRISDDNGAPRMDPFDNPTYTRESGYKRDQGPIIHIQPEEVPRRD